MTPQPPTRTRNTRTPAHTPASAPATTTEPPAHKPPVARSSPPVRSIVPRKKPGADWHGLRRIKLELSLVLALLVVLGLVHAPMQFEQEFTMTVADQEIVEMEEITQTKQVEPPPPPPQPPVPVEVPNDAVLDTEMELNLDATLDINEPLANLPPPPPPPAEEVVEEEVEEEDAEIFVAVEEMPVLIGGIEGIAARLRYPEMAQLAGIEGRVFVQFVINKEGRVEDAVVIKGQGGGLDEEALRVVRTAQFKPGKQRGKPVKVRMSMPITFRLEDKK